MELDHGMLMQYSSMAERDRKDQGEDMIAQSKRARAGSLAIVDQGVSFFAGDIFCLFLT